MPLYSRKSTKIHVSFKRDEHKQKRVMMYSHTEIVQTSKSKFRYLLYLHSNNLYYLLFSLFTVFLLIDEYSPRSKQTKCVQIDGSRSTQSVDCHTGTLHSLLSVNQGSIYKYDIIIQHG